MPKTVPQGQSFKYFRDQAQRYAFLGSTANVSPPTPPADDWILATGFWRDEGFWRDDKNWID